MGMGMGDRGNMPRWLGRGMIGMVSYLAGKGRTFPGMVWVLEAREAY